MSCLTIRDQVVEILRLSRLYQRVGDTLEVGGRTQLVAQGEFAAEII